MVVCTSHSEISAKADISLLVYIMVILALHLIIFLSICHLSLCPKTPSMCLFVLILYIPSNNILVVSCRNRTFYV